MSPAAFRGENWESRQKAQHVQSHKGVKQCDGFRDTQAVGYHKVQSAGGGNEASVWLGQKILMGDEMKLKQILGYLAGSVSGA